MNNAMAEFEKRNKEQHDKLNQMRPYQQQTVLSMEQHTMRTLHLLLTM